MDHYFTADLSYQYDPAAYAAYTGYYGRAAAPSMPTMPTVPATTTRVQVASDYDQYNKAVAEYNKWHSDYTKWYNATYSQPASAAPTPPPPPPAEPSKPPLPPGPEPTSTASYSLFSNPSSSAYGNSSSTSRDKHYGNAATSYGSSSTTSSSYGGHTNSNYATSTSVQYGKYGTIKTTSQTATTPSYGNANTAASKSVYQSKTSAAGDYLSYRKPESSKSNNSYGQSYVYNAPPPTTKEQSKPSVANTPAYANVLQYYAKHGTKKPPQPKVYSQPYKAAYTPAQLSQKQEQPLIKFQKPKVKKPKTKKTPEERKRRKLLKLRRTFVLPGMESDSTETESEDEGKEEAAIKLKKDKQREHQKKVEEAKQLALKRKEELMRRQAGEAPTDQPVQEMEQGTYKDWGDAAPKDAPPKNPGVTHAIDADVSSLYPSLVANIADGARGAESPECTESTEGAAGADNADTQETYKDWGEAFPSVENKKPAVRIWRAAKNADVAHQVLRGVGALLGQIGDPDTEEVEEMEVEEPKKPEQKKKKKKKKKKEEEEDDGDSKDANPGRTLLGIAAMLGRVEETKEHIPKTKEPEPAVVSFDSFMNRDFTGRPGLPTGPAFPAPRGRDDPPFGPRSLDGPPFGPRDLDGPSFGPRSLGGPPFGPRDLDGPSFGERRPGGPPFGARDFDGPPFGERRPGGPPFGPRDFDGPRFGERRLGGPPFGALDGPPFGALDGPPFGALDGPPFGARRFDEPPFGRPSDGPSSSTVQDDKKDGNKVFMEWGEAAADESATYSEWGQAAPTRNEWQVVESVGPRKEAIADTGSFREWGAVAADNPAGGRHAGSTRSEWQTVDSMRQRREPVDDARPFKEWGEIADQRKDVGRRCVDDFGPRPAERWARDMDVPADGKTWGAPAQAPVAPKNRNTSAWTVVEKEEKQPKSILKKDESADEPPPDPVRTDPYSELWANKGMTGLDEGKSWDSPAPESNPLKSGWTRLPPKPRSNSEWTVVEKEDKPPVPAADDYAQYDTEEAYAETDYYDNSDYGFGGARQFGQRPALPGKSQREESSIQARLRRMAGDDAPPLPGSKSTAQRMGNKKQSWAGTGDDELGFGGGSGFSGSQARGGNRFAAAFGDRSSSNTGNRFSGSFDSKSSGGSRFDSLFAKSAKLPPPKASADGSIHDELIGGRIKSDLLYEIGTSENPSQTAKKILANLSKKVDLKKRKDVVAELSRKVAERTEELLTTIAADGAGAGSQSDAQGSQFGGRSANQNSRSTFDYGHKRPSQNKTGGTTSRWDSQIRRKPEPVEDDDSALPMSFGSSKEKRAAGVACTIPVKRAKPTELDESNRRKDDVVLSKANPESKKVMYNVQRTLPPGLFEMLSQEPQPTPEPEPTSSYSAAAYETGQSRQYGKKKQKKESKFDIPKNVDTARSGYSRFVRPSGQ